MLVEKRLSWINNECVSAAEKLRREIEGVAEVNWWIEEEWQVFFGRLNSRAKLAELLEKVWDDFTKAAGMDRLNSDLTDYAWILPPSEVNASIYPGFERMFLTSLRRFRYSYTDMMEAFKVIFGDVGRTRKYQVEKAHQRIESGESLDYLDEISVPEMKLKIQKLNNVPISGALNSISAIGVWSDDAELLRGKIADIARSRTLSLEEFEGGIVIK
ncbi:MAG: hypothetical protein GF309_00170 [Candidatus Lokiarchaeota archaeon]|nr:hypothetical protein [Candidatus Lokiarchaeota archaeon]